jgi:integrase/recombinase XerC
MNQLALAPSVPALVNASGPRAEIRFLEFFAANIRNGHTRRAYAQAVREFLAWCAAVNVRSIADVQPLHVAAYIEQLGRNDQRRPSSSALPRSATCSTGW